MSTKQSPRDLGLSSSSFVTGVTEAAFPRVILNVEAKPKTGKTFLSLDAPGPIVLFNFDNGLRGVVEQFQRKGKTVVIAGMPDKNRPSSIYPSYSFPRLSPKPGETRKTEAYLDRMKAKAMPIWEKWIEDYDQFLESKARTGIIDTGGAAFALGKFAFHGMSSVKPKDDPYGQKGGELKAIFQDIITKAYSYDKNVIWTHRLKEMWVGGQPSGEFEVDGYKQLPYEIEATIRLTKYREPKKRVWVRRAEIRDCRINDDLNGEKFEGRACSFANIMSSVFPETDAEDWE